MKPKDLTIQAMVRIEQCQMHQKALDAVVSYLYDAGRGIHKQLNTGELRDQLYSLELQEWRNAFMWSLAVDEDVRERVRAAAHERFLANNMAVEHHFTGKAHPSRWLVADEEEFRAMARAAFAPKEKP